MKPSDQRWKPNVTVAAIICREVDGRPEFLLIEEKTPEGLRFNNPAGHLDPGESPEQGVVREVLEETTRTFTPTSFVGLYLSRYQRPSRGEDVTYLRLAYAGTVGEADPARALDTGIVRTLWMGLDELNATRARHRSTLVMTGIEHYLAGQRHPLGLVHADATVWHPEVKD